MRKVRKILLFAVAVIFLCVSAVNVSAREDENYFEESEWQQFSSLLPDEVGDFAGSEKDFFESVEEKSDIGYIAKSFFNYLGIELSSSLKLFGVLCALVVISSVFGSAAVSLSNPALSTAIRFCSGGAIFATVIYAQYAHFERIEGFFSSIGGLMSAMIPMSAGIWAMGGNVETAGAGTATLYVMLGVCERLLGGSIIPVCCVMSVLALCDALSDEMKTARMLFAIKRTYNFFSGIVMTLLISSLGAQTAISSAADSTVARTARMVSGSIIPVLGGSVGETLRTVAGGVSYLKTVFGIGGILMIFAIVVPVALSVLLGRVAFLICGGIADTLGCANEARLLDNLGEIYGSMLAVISVVSVTFILAISIFMRTVVAVA